MGVGGVIPAGGGAQAQPQPQDNSGYIQMTAGHFVWLEQRVCEDSREAETKQRQRKAGAQAAEAWNVRADGGFTGSLWVLSPLLGHPQGRRVHSFPSSLAIQFLPQVPSHPLPTPQGNISTRRPRGQRASRGGWTLMALSCMLSFAPPRRGSQTGGPELSLALRPALFGPHCVF